MATIKDVARVAGVSIATVSRVVNGQGKVGAQCRTRVQKVIEQLNYRPNSNAKALVKRSTNTIGIVTPNLSMSFFSSLACGAERAARERGYGLIMRNSLYETQSEIDAIESLRDQNCDAIILHSEYSDESTLIGLTEQIPGLVIINRFIPKIADRCVWLDNVTSAQEATNYLLDRGHKDFAVITSIYQNRDPASRILGVRQALLLRDMKLPLDAIEESTANMEGGEAAVQALLARGTPFTAILAYNDLMAIGAIHALFAAGIRVPEDVSVIGFDDLSIARACRPRLTTMHYPIEEMANYATDLAIKLASNATTESRNTHLFLSNLVERDSVAALV
ncbi:transcriptional regulator [Shewanella baltica]|uniref:LacI family DNA-binding transcriptional regulator n=1 Tax=Shewanella baltica TaxID=62322 RepID=UPI0007B4AAE8|nr:LacI family DNA-binding transcriptional regulator [Shewanella baltica]KZK69353.1 transcriptional regulator [Shewanella baltica]